MTAQGLAAICGVAVLALCATPRSATAEPWQTFGLDDGFLAKEFIDTRVAARGYEPMDGAADGMGIRFFGEGGLWGLLPKLSGPVVPYAGFGLGKINVAMDLETGDVELEKENRFTKARLILGVAYPMSKSVSLGMEYHAVASNDPLFSLDISGQSLEFDTKFTRHFLNLNVRYEF